MRLAACQVLRCPSVCCARKAHFLVTSTASAASPAHYNFLSLSESATQVSTGTAISYAPTITHGLLIEEFSFCLQALAGICARERSAGDCYCLLGAVGAGKSAFRYP